MSDSSSEPGFNARWYLKRYPDVANGPMDPLEHYRQFGKAEGREPGPKPFWSMLFKRWHMIRIAVAAAVAHAGGIRPAIAKAVNVARREGWFTTDFDQQFYLRQYPDIAQSGVDPYQHFIQHGRAEGRLGVRPELHEVAGGVAHDPSRPTVLVVSHEASLTGAPILSLNLTQGLGEKYNVFSLLLGDGPLVDSFRELSVQVAGPVQHRYNAALVDDAIGQLVDRHAFKFAIVNSIECAAVLEPLARRSVPSVALIHEFASYTRPKSAFRNAFFWANEVVFSTRLTYQDALAQYPELAGKHCEILPQGRCVVLSKDVDGERRDREVARIRSALRPPGLAPGTLLVLGIGSVHIRKGVDLFIDCAARVVKAVGARPCRFVWIGRGYNPETDLAYSVYLADQIRRSGLQDFVHFLNDTPEIEEAYEIADMLLLTSRLDPLPNVAIDAMAHGLPVLCFAGTTGIADILAGQGMAAECVAPYLDTSAMAAQVLALANSPELQGTVGEKLRAIAREQFDMPRYVAGIDDIAQAACAMVATERESAEEIHQSQLSRPDFLAPARTPLVAAEDIRWDYLRPWTSGIRRRKLFPGFHPGIYGEQALEPGPRTADPLTSYLRAGRPSGPWQHEVITGAETALPVAAELAVALHLHVYYPDLLPEIVRGLARNRLRPHLFVSVPSAAMVAGVQAALAGCSERVEVEVVPNRGRDIGPFLTGFAARLREYQLVGHLHTKKTADVADAAMGEDWRRFLIENLLAGGNGMMDIIVGRMAADETIGLVFPDDPHVVDWNGNLVQAQELCRRLGMAETLPRHFVFPVGTMFWARVEAIRPLLQLGLDWSDYPAEPLPYDGSMLHALERLLPFVAAKQGFRSVLTNVSGVSR
jgi:glycosyltransferase involved in cell wall biosynthesis